MEKFILNDVASLSESKSVKFQKISENKNAISYIKLTASKYITAFLNSSNVNRGSIFFGIHDDRIVAGAKFSLGEISN